MNPIAHSALCIGGPNNGKVYRNIGNQFRVIETTPASFKSGFMYGHLDPAPVFNETRYELVHLAVRNVAGFTGHYEVWLHESKTIGEAEAFVTRVLNAVGDLLGAGSR